MGHICLKKNVLVVVAAVAVVVVIVHPFIYSFI
jgi:hypothetical protein